MSKKTGRILVVDDNLGIRRTLQMILPQYFKEVKTLASPNELISSLRDFQPDVVLLDMNFKAVVNSGNEGLFWLNEIKKYSSSVEVILFTAYGDIQLAVEGMKKGAFDFIVKPWDNDNLISTLRDAILKSKGDKGWGAEPYEMVWGKSLRMMEIKNLISKVAPADINILLLGENGVGKDLMATEIHKQSLRKDKSFIAVDMGALTDTLFESELFGHVKGAFTGAISDHKGKFEQADGGTLFLDEIGNLPLHLQAKLLRVLQNKNVTRVGGNKEIPVDVRIICATNKNLEEEVKKGNFREDLFYRISGFQITLPSLQDRKEDILPLSDNFLRIFNSKYHKSIKGFSDDVIRYIMSQPWKGNIRELKSFIERSVILAEGEMIDMQDISAGLKPDETPTPICGDEKTQIANALEKTGRNISAAAKLLNMSRPTLYSKINKYHL